MVGEGMGEGGAGRLLGLEGHAFMLAVLSPFLSASSAGRQAGRPGKAGRLRCVLLQYCGAFPPQQ